MPTEGRNQGLVGAIPFCSEYLGPRFEDHQMNGISNPDGDQMTAS